MNETWKTIKTFPDYEASSDGRIRRILGAILKPNISGRYAMVSLYRDHKQFQVCIHRIVCITFHGEPPTEKHHAAHDDGDRLNNSSSNLLWKTPKENEADKLRHGTSPKGKPSKVPPELRARGKKHGRSTMPERSARGERIATAKLTGAKVTSIRNDKRSRKSIAADYGITVTMVGYIVRGISWKHIPIQTEQKL